MIVFANRKDQVKRLYDKLNRQYKVVILSGDVIKPNARSIWHNFVKAMPIF